MRTVDWSNAYADFKYRIILPRREKVLEGKSRVSHSVHCPYFTDDKQEFWWAYIADRKNHLLITPPNHVTSLVDREEVELKFTAPLKPGEGKTTVINDDCSLLSVHAGLYNYTVHMRSDSYLGVDLQDEIKLDVHEARAAPTEHPQWEFEDDDEDAEGDGDADSDDDFATDDEFEDDDGDGGEDSDD